MTQTSSPPQFLIISNLYETLLRNLAAYDIVTKIFKLY